MAKMGRMVEPCLVSPNTYPTNSNTLVIHTRFYSFIVKVIHGLLLNTYFIIKISNSLQDSSTGTVVLPDTKCQLLKAKHLTIEINSPMILSAAYINYVFLSKLLYVMGHHTTFILLIDIYFPTALTICIVT